MGTEETNEIKTPFLNISKIKKFSELQYTDFAHDTAKLLIHDFGGVKKILKKDFNREITDWQNKYKTILEPMVEVGDLAHNNVYRGKSLGYTVTDEQYNEIISGEFKGMYIGDYWEIGNNKYRIAHFDYYYNTGDDHGMCYKHHITLVPDVAIHKDQINPNIENSGGYMDSQIRKQNLKQIEQDLRKIFANHIMSYRLLTSNAINIVHKEYRIFTSSWDWDDANVELLNEMQVYGSVVRGRGGFNASNNDRQLKLFTFNPNLIHNGQTYWLLDIYDIGAFCCVNGQGHADALNVTKECFIRPVFSIC